MNCKVCGREIEESEYCSLHLRAYKNIYAKFDLWQKASAISWKEYLSEIQKNSLTGEWAKDVAKYLFEDECRHVKENKEERV